MAIQGYRAKQYSGTATTTPTKIELPRLGFRLRVKNTGATNALGLSLDGGKTFYPIAPTGSEEGSEFAEDVLVHYFWIRAEASTTTYSIVAFVG
jgi:hypothetical protein